MLCISCKNSLIPPPVFFDVLFINFVERFDVPVTSTASIPILTAGPPFAVTFHFIVLGLWQLRKFLPTFILMASFLYRLVHRAKPRGHQYRTFERFCHVKNAEMILSSTNCRFV